MLIHLYLSKPESVRHINSIEKRFDRIISLFIERPQWDMVDFIFNFLSVADSKYVVLYITTPKHRYIKDLISRIPNVVAVVLVKEKVKLYRKLNVRYVNVYIAKPSDSEHLHRMSDMSKVTYEEFEASLMKYGSNE